MLIQWDFTPLPFELLEKVFILLFKGYWILEMTHKHIGLTNQGGFFLGISFSSIKYIKM